MQSREEQTLRNDGSAVTVADQGTLGGRAAGNAALKQRQRAAFARAVTARGRRLAFLYLLVGIASGVGFVHLLTLALPVPVTAFLAEGLVVGLVIGVPFAAYALWKATRERADEELFRKFALVEAQTTTVFPLTSEQRRAIRRALNRRWPFIVGVSVVGGVVMAAYIASGLGRDSGAVPLAAGAAFAFLLPAGYLAQAALIGREKVALRTTGSLSVERYSIPEYGSAGAFASLLQVRRAWRYVVVTGGKKVALDREVPEIASVGQIEYTKNERHPLAIFDSAGNVIWHHPGYEPAARAKAWRAADTMGMT